MVTLCHLLDLYIVDHHKKFQNPKIKGFCETIFYYFQWGDFHPALQFQEVLSWYLWNDRSTIKIEESRLQLFVNFEFTGGPPQIRNVHFYYFFGDFGGHFWGISETVALR